MHPRVDYDAIAAAYDRRYLKNDFSGVEQALLEFVGRDADARVLEVGCGTGHWLQFLPARGIWVAGVDASIGMLTQAKAQVQRPVVHGVAEHLPWSNQSLDRVFCVNALHHFQDKRRFLSEAHRVLRRGGRMMTIGLDPHAGIDQWYVYNYFESALETDTRRYASTSQIRQWMDADHFVDCDTRVVQHIPVRLSARAALEQGRLDKSATSQLSVLTDEQYAQGISRIRSGLESAEAQGESLYLTADLRLYATVGSVE